MKKTTQIFSASIITLFTLVLFAGIQTATAQEWLVFSNKSVLTLEGGEGNLNNTAPRDENNWLNTQTPLIDRTPITNSGQTHRNWTAPRLERQYSQKSWAPLETEASDQNFKLFSF